MIVKIQNEVKNVTSPCRILDLFTNTGYHFVAAKVNNRLRELNYIIPEDAEVELLDLTHGDAVRMYQATFRYVAAMAVKNIWPRAKIHFNYSVSRSIFATVSGLGHALLEKNFRELEAEIKRIIQADYPISRFSMTKEEAIEYYKGVGQMDKVRILKFRKEDTVHVYECEGYKNYMFGYMLPSTGYLTKYRLRLYAPGFLIQYPRSECKGEIPEFNDEQVFRLALKEANIWANTAKSESISQMNEIIESGQALEFINVCEARHNRQFAELGQKIIQNIDSVRLICVAGPSSSGKTTFTNRLRIELKSRGITPLMISMDNFYNPIEMAPKDENGNPDLEHIEALDLELFDDVIFRLIQGEEVQIPIYNFYTHERTFTEPIKLTSRQPIMIEGIHGLNDQLAPSIGEDRKFKIYIAPLGQYKIDDHNPISISDIRLIRRMVRDHQFRGTGCEKTLSNWQSVRNGEFKWIYPFQKQADFVFNSELSYELCVLKHYAVPLLQAVPTDSQNFVTANRLLKFLKYFEEITNKWIPCNSLLREFIGDSIFYTEDTK